MIRVVGKSKLNRVKKLDQSVGMQNKKSDSLVDESLKIDDFSPSSMEPVKFRVNLRGPPRKAKYY